MIPYPEMPKESKKEFICRTCGKEFASEEVGGNEGKGHFAHDPLDENCLRPCGPVVRKDRYFLKLEG